MPYRSLVFVVGFLANAPLPLMGPVWAAAFALGTRTTAGQADAPE